MPPQLTEPLTHFATPDLATPAARPLAYCVAFGASAAEAIFSPNRVETWEFFKRGYTAGLGLSDTTVAEALDATQREATSRMSLFDVSPDAAPDPWEMLERANEAIVDRNLQTQAENVRLQELAMPDSLTGLPNRRRLDEFVAEQCQLAAKLHQPLSLVLIDLNDFKYVNDTYRHPAGDAVLTAVAAALEATVRSGDPVARYGGDEFVVVSPGNTASGAYALANHLRNSIGALSVVHKGTTIRVTGRVGGAFAAAGTNPSLAALLAGADGALYAAKADGHDSVRFSKNRAA